MRWTLLLVASLGLFASLAYFKVQALVVRTEKGKIVALKVAKQGDVVEIHHVNSIFDAPVTELLEVRGKELQLAGVYTPSHGVKEYYGIGTAHSAGERRWRKLTFMSTGALRFRVCVNERFLFEGQSFSLALEDLRVAQLVFRLCRPLSF